MHEIAVSVLLSVGRRGQRASSSPSTCLPEIVGRHKELAEGRHRGACAVGALLPVGLELQALPVLG